MAAERCGGPDIAPTSAKLPMRLAFWLRKLVDHAGCSRLQKKMQKVERADLKNRF